MMLCWSANKVSSARSTARAVVQGAVAEESSDFGTAKFPTNPTAYKNVARKIT
jgi:hypothetical protein